HPDDEPRACHHRADDATGAGDHDSGDAQLPERRQCHGPGAGPRIIRVTERFEVPRQIAAPPAKVFALLCDPNGHVAIDSSGMLQSADGKPVGAVGDSFVVHMDRESLNDYPLGKYDVTVTITKFEQDRLIEWTISG